MAKTKTDRMEYVSRKLTRMTKDELETMAYEMISDWLRNQDDDGGVNGSEFIDDFGRTLDYFKVEP